MINLILKLGKFGGPYEDRAKISTYTGFFGIITNVILSIIKVTIGLVSGSISVLADGVNNIFDVFSAVVTIIGVKLSRKPADKEHPYGHGRIEYLSALIICIFVLIVGIQFLFASYKKIVNGSKDEYSFIFLILMSLSILIKVYIVVVYKTIGEKIDSSPLKATATDAIGDVLVTSIVLINIFTNKIFKIHIDGIIGIIVSIFIIFSAFSLLKDTVSNIIGEAPSDDIIKKIKDSINSYEDVKGCHDVRVVSFGPEDKFAIVDVEFDHNMNIYDVHSIVDNMEHQLKNQLKLNFIIHPEPAGMKAKKYKDAEKGIEEIMETTRAFVGFHDLIIRDGVINFDAVVDGNIIKSSGDRDKIDKEIENKLKEKFKDYTFNIEIKMRY